MSQDSEDRLRKAKPVGKASFVWAGEPMTLPIVKLGKRDITVRSDDGTLITFNKRGVKIELEGQEKTGCPA